MKTELHEALGHPTFWLDDPCSFCGEREQLWRPSWEKEKLVLSFHGDSMCMGCALGRAWTTGSPREDVALAIYDLVESCTDWEIRSENERSIQGSILSLVETLEESA